MFFDQIFAGQLVGLTCRPQTVHVLIKLSVQVRQVEQQLQAAVIDPLLHQLAVERARHIVAARAVFILINQLVSVVEPERCMI